MIIKGCLALLAFLEGFVIVLRLVFDPTASCRNFPGCLHKMLLDLNLLDHREGDIDEFL